MAQASAIRSSFFTVQFPRGLKFRLSTFRKRGKEKTPIQGLPPIILIPSISVTKFYCSLVAGSPRRIHVRRMSRVRTARLAAAAASPIVRNLLG